VLVALLAASTGLARAQDEPQEPPTGGAAGEAPVAEAAAPAPTPEVPAGKKKVSFRDPEDGAFDYSDYLLNHRGFLPVPFLITEPAVGYGGGLSLLFFQESIAAAQGEQIERGERWAPPNIGGVAAFMTSNGTWGGGAGYFGSARGDRYRYEAELAKVSLVLDYYGPRQIPREFTIEAPYVRAYGLARVGKSDLFLGARYLYFGAVSRFNGERPFEILPDEIKSPVALASLLVDYDSRDNILTPSRGLFLEVDIGWSRPALGSKRSFNSQMARCYGYIPIGRSVILGLRADGQFTSGSVPFYALPYIVQRGIPAMRYQGQNTLVGEVEVRIGLTRRWALVVFGGGGKAYGEFNPFDEAELVGGGGAGFRYLIARKLGMWAGIDLAQGSGSDQSDIYFQVGSAWR
jgi:hypothetical protein